MIQKKTGGIALFVRTFLKELHEIGMIGLSLSSCTWNYDIDAISRLEMSKDIVQHLVEKMLRLPQHVIIGLQIAAILGSSFDLQTYTHASSKGLSADDFLYIVTESGFINLVEGQFTWSHSKIHEAAYSLIPISALESLHLLVGTRIYIKTENKHINDKIHIIVSNMNMGLRCLDKEELRAELAHLNLLAGSKSAAESAFYSAANYFMIGVSLLGEDWHVRRYSLGMELFHAAAEALLVTGNTEMFKTTIEKPITHARNLDDRLPASLTHVRFLLTSGKIDEAASKCFSILHEFGEDFPNELTPQTVYLELVETKDVLSKYSKDDFLNLPTLDAPMKSWAVEFMQIACKVLFCQKAEYIPVMACRIVKISAAHGWSPSSAFGLVTFGHSLISVMNAIDDGLYW